MTPLRRTPDPRWRPAASVDVATWHRIGAAGAFCVATVGLLASIATDEFDRQVMIRHVAAVVVLGACYAVLRRFHSRRSLLVWPLIVVIGLSTSAISAPEAASLTMGTVVVAFLFAGLTQARGVGLVMVVPAAVAFGWVNRALPAEQVAVKLSVAVFVWIAACELPAWLTANLRAARIDLERLAATDPLTGLANRRYWDEHLAQVLEQGPATAVLLVDLDHFKRFNDDHGHLAGDEMLIAFARMIEQATPVGDVASRWGGEEFALALRDARRAPQVAEEIRRSVPLGQTCSIGLVTHLPGESPRELMHRADEALYQAKSNGRDRVVAA